MPPLLPRPSRRSSLSFPLSSPSPLRTMAVALPPAEPPQRGWLAIVDYAHDEMTMSRVAVWLLEGKIMCRTGGLGSDVQIAEELLLSGKARRPAFLFSLGNLEERTCSGTVHILTLNTQPELFQHSGKPEQNRLGSDKAMDVAGAETEDTQMKEAANILTNVHNDDPLSCFLPPTVTTKSSAELQFYRFLAYKKSGKSFNAEVCNIKDYRNPDFLQHAVHYQEIDQIGTCFSKDVFDPYGYDESNCYDEIGYVPALRFDFIMVTVSQAGPVCYPE